MTLPAFAAERRAAAQLLLGAPAAVDRYLPPAGRPAANPAARRYCCRSTGQTDGQTDRHPTVT